ncbi:unnamed protein product [Auanema sp. JU1783]|nr:unnamed protein product [Auanema sp. JU1783]
MGNCESTEVKERRQQNAISKKIDKELAPKNELREKLLLLGPGESGKSTCLKQMKLLHHNGFSDNELMEKRSVIFSNVVQNLSSVLMLLEEKHIPLDDSSLEPQCRLIRKLQDEEIQEINSELKNALCRLWADKGVKKAFEYRQEIHMTESAAYFFDNIERLAAKDYKPTVQDILHTRVPTTGVVKFMFTFREINFEVFDVGGQRSERRKWIHCFDDCDAIIYIAAISEYDQVIKEDNSTNRLMEAIDLFSGIANSQYFTECSIILFLNKKDLFENKIKKVPLKKCFTSYTGENEYEPAVKYIRRRFVSNVKNGRKPYVHETCATDTTQVTHVINSVIDTIIHENMKDTGML